MFGEGKRRQAKRGRLGESGLGRITHGAQLRRPVSIKQGRNYHKKGRPMNTTRVRHAGRHAR